MEFSLPEIHEISVEVDGQRFDGCWYVVRVLWPSHVGSGLTSRA
ncbi:MAG: hypothetical protein ACF8TS_06385 [Maioricimonas sp. JB049]